MFNSADWSQSQKDTIANLGGVAGVESRIPQLSPYDRTQVVAQIDYDTGENGFTATQMKAWASFGETFGKDVTVNGREIRRPKTQDELALTVVRNELSRLQTEKWRAEQAAKKAAEDS